MASLEYMDALNERYSLATRKRASRNFLHQYSLAYVLFSVLILLVFESKPFHGPCQCGSVVYPTAGKTNVKAEPEGCCDTFENATIQCSNKTYVKSVLPFVGRQDYS